jgi:hypothetical protein
MGRNGRLISRRRALQAAASGLGATSVLAGYLLG